MIIGQPLGLIALAGLPVLVALHLWRARHAPHPVSGLFLWPAERRILATGRQRAPLVLRPSFWCEALLILAASWWLADLHWSPRMAARHLIIVLDDRWRLQAVDADGSTCASRLRETLDQRLAGLDPGDRATLIASGTPPRLLAGPAAAPAAARAALAGWRPAAAWHGLDPALTLAAGLAGSGGEVSVASDRKPDHLPVGYGAIALGRPATTSGLADARWWREHGSERLVAVVRADLAQHRQLRLAIGGKDLDTVDLDLTATAPRTVVWSRPTAAGDRPLPELPEDAEATLDLLGPDPLPIDDHAVLLRPLPRLVLAQVGLTGTVGTAVRSALVAAGAQVVKDGPAGLAVGAPGGPGTWTLEIFPGDGPATRGPYTANCDHPLLRDLDFSDVLWCGGTAFTDTVPLLFAGDRMLISLPPGREPAIMLHLDPRKTNLFQTAAWPCLFANLVAWRASRLPGVAEPNPRCGQQVGAVLPPGERSAILTGPEGGEKTLRADADGSITLPGPSQAGLWTLRAGGTAWRISALPLDARQAELAGATSGELAAIPAGQSSVERARGPLATLLPLLIAALAGCGAWLAFRREETP